jgi:hypothetical protein
VIIDTMEQMMAACIAVNAGANGHILAAIIWIQFIITAITNGGISW